MARLDPGTTVNACAWSGSSAKPGSLPGPKSTPETWQGSLPSLPSVTPLLAVVLRMTLPKSTASGATVKSQPMSMSADSGIVTFACASSLLSNTRFPVRWCGSARSVAWKVGTIDCSIPGASEKWSTCAGSSANCGSLPGAIAIPAISHVLVPLLTTATEKLAVLSIWTCPKLTAKGRKLSLQSVRIRPASGTSKRGRIGSLLCKTKVPTRASGSDVLVGLKVAARGACSPGFTTSGCDASGASANEGSELGASTG